MVEALGGQVLGRLGFIVSLSFAMHNGHYSKHNIQINSVKHSTKTA